MSTTPRTVLITGATGGLGQGLARRLAREEAIGTVVLGVRDERRGAALADVLRTQLPGRRFVVSVMEVASPASVRAAVARLDDPVDAVVLNAGGTGGARPLERTADGATQVVASNVLGHAALVGALHPATVELVGSEAAVGVPALHIPAPDIEDGSRALFTSWIDGSWFAGRRVDRGLAYGQAKLLGALWVGAHARRHGGHAVAMSPGNTAGTGVHRDLPAPLRVLVPRIMALLGRSHSVADGAERLATGLLDPAYGDGRFWASAQGRLTGPVVDQATILPALADPTVQDNAYAAIAAFTSADRTPCR